MKRPPRPLLDGRQSSRPLTLWVLMRDQCEQSDSSTRGRVAAAEPSCSGRSAFANFFAEGAALTKAALAQGSGRDHAEFLVLALTSEGRNILSQPQPSIAPGSIVPPQQPRIMPAQAPSRHPSSRETSLAKAALQAPSCQPQQLRFKPSGRSIPITNSTATLKTHGASTPPSPKPRSIPPTRQPTGHPGDPARQDPSRSRAARRQPGRSAGGVFLEAAHLLRFKTHIPKLNSYPTEPLIARQKNSLNSSSKSSTSRRRAAAPATTLRLQDPKVEELQRLADAFSTESPREC